MSKKKVIHAPRATDRLWGAIRGVGWWYIVSATFLAAAFLFRGIALGALDSSEYFSEADMLPGEDLVLLLLGVAAISLIVAYLTGAFLVLRWYLRSIRNAHVLHRGIQTTPRWVIWSFIVPVISLIKPYTMTSELWRSSHRPDDWRKAGDPSILRWWWGLLLLGSLLSTIADGIGRSADTAGVVQASAFISLVSLALQIVASLLFLRIGGRISRLQTELVIAGHRPPEPTAPAWAP